MSRWNPLTHLFITAQEKQNISREMGEEWSRNPDTGEKTLLPFCPKSYSHPRVDIIIFSRITSDRNFVPPTVVTCENRFVTNFKSLGKEFFFLCILPPRLLAISATPHFQSRHLCQLLMFNFLCLNWPGLACSALPEEKTSPSQSREKVIGSWTFLAGSYDPPDTPTPLKRT